MDSANAPAVALVSEILAEVVPVGTYTFHYKIFWIWSAGEKIGFYGPDDVLQRMSGTGNRAQGTL